MAAVLPYITSDGHGNNQMSIANDGEEEEDEDSGEVSPVTVFKTAKTDQWRPQLPISADLLSIAMAFLSPAQRRVPRLVCKEFNIAATRREIWRGDLRYMWGQGALTARHLAYEPHQRWVQAMMCWEPLPLGISSKKRDAMQQARAESIIRRAWEYAVDTVSNSEDVLAPDRCFPVWRLMVLMASAYVLYCPDPVVREDYDARDFMMCDVTGSCTADMERPFGKGETFNPNDMTLRVWSSAKEGAVQIVTMSCYPNGALRIAMKYPRVNDKTILRTGDRKGNADDLWAKKTLAEYRHYMMRGATKAISALPQCHETRRWYTPSARIYQAELDASAAQKWVNEGAGEH